MNPLSTADKFNTHFIDIIDELKLRTKLYNGDQGSWNLNPNSLYLATITANELVYYKKIKIFLCFKLSNLIR
jgi:hypothetical protein